MNPRLLFILPLICFSIQSALAQESEPENVEPPADKEKSEKGEKQETEKPAPAKPKVVAKPAIKQKYVVKSGDNMWKIAKAHEVEMRALLHENDLENANALKIGDILTLPVDVVSKNPPPPEPEKKEEPKVTSSSEKSEEKPAGDGEWEMYTIQSGDNPWKIAKTKGLDHQAIVKLNPGLDFTKLAVGQEIKIPKK